MNLGSNSAQHMDHKPIRLLVIGGGAIVSECHLPAMQQTGQSKGSAIVDISAENLAILRAIDAEVEIIQQDFREVLARPGLSDRFDAALVTLPNAMHDEAVILCIAAGLDVLCEKPLANTVQRCEKLAAQAEQSGCKLAIAMVRRYVPAFLLLKESIISGRIGKVIRLDVTHGAKFAWPANSGFYFRKAHGGLLLNMGVHYLDQLQSVFGELTPIQYSDDADGGVESNFKLELRTAAGIIITLQLSYTHSLDNTLVCQGELGTLSYPVGQFDAIDWQPVNSPIKGKFFHNKPFESGDWQPTFEACFIEQLADFSAAVKGEKAVLVDAASAVLSARLIEQCYSLKSRGNAPVQRTEPTLRPMLMPGKVFVTGGTGFVGGKLFERLAEMPDLTLVAAIRSFMNAAPVARYDVDFQQVSLTSPEQLRAAMKGCRYAFHLAYGADGAGGAKFTVESTRAVVEAAIACELESIVVVSTCSVFGTQAGRADENSPYAPSLGHYGSSKAEAERIALQLGAVSNKTRVIVICPSAVYGPSGPTFTEMPVKMSKVGSFCWVDGGIGQANYVYVDNLIDALVLAAGNPTAHAKRYIISDGVCSWRQFLGPLVTDFPQIPDFTEAQLQAASSKHRRPNVRQLVNALLINNAPFMALASAHPVLSNLKTGLMRLMPNIHRKVQAARNVKPSFSSAIIAPSMPPAWLADLFGRINIEYVSGRARDELGWQSLVPLQEGQRRAVQWLKHMGITSGKP